MSDDEDESQDVSTALLDTCLSLPSKTDSISSRTNNKQRNKSDDQDSTDFLDIFSHESTGRSKLNGSSFRNMGFGTTLMKAITRKGYQNPTPIQRKTIPPIMHGRDVVGMARTGSGKTASFVLPMIEKLKMHSARVGARAIVMAPSRELALQTLKVVKEMSKGTDLRTILLVGGDSLEEQFGSVMNNPDIIVATPGRFLHLLVEMNLNLGTVEYIVFDEADRLFEMGFEAQLTEILHKLPQSRQTLLFSATLPASLVEFAKAGLQDPLLIRLDVESKISEDLETAFFTIKPVEKEAGLLYLLQEVIKVPDASSKIIESESTGGRKRKRSESKGPGITPQSTLIFVSTKHQAEYISNLLRRANYAISYVYGSLDQVARRENVDSFRSGETSILVVTDVAARGIDIPILSNVINYDFPAEPKIFVHRVGRTARAGRRGWAYSLVTSVDAPYLCELIDFLGRPVVWNGYAKEDINFSKDLAIGTIPRGPLERAMEWVDNVVRESSDLEALKNVAIKGNKLYLKTRGDKTGEMLKKGKALMQENGWKLVNPLLGKVPPPVCLIVVTEEEQDQDQRRLKLLNSVSEFRPEQPVFLAGQSGAKEKTVGAGILKYRRAKEVNPPEPIPAETDDISDEKAMTSNPALGKGSFRDTEFYISHFQPGLAAQEHGYDVNRPTNSFVEASRGAVLNLLDDQGVSFAPSKPKQRWDPKKKDFVNIANDEDGGKGKKMIKGESGVKIPASMRSGRFESWQNAHQTRLPETGTESRFEGPGKRFKHTKNKAPKAPDRFRDDYHVKKKRAAEIAEPRQAGGQLRTAEQIRKLRQQKEKRKQKNARPSRKKH